METIIRKTRAVGNSSGVLLPRHWLNKKVVVTLAELSEKEILKEVIEILYNKKILSSVLGIYLVGSYARKEQTKESDVDILIITKEHDKTREIKENIYSILVIPKNRLEKNLEKNILPLLPMIKESKTLLNDSLIKNYKDIKLTKKNLEFHLETTKSALEINRASIALSKNLGEKCPNGVLYSLILRLREIYIIDCLINEKMWSKKGFLKFLEKIPGSKEAHQIYLKVKNNENTNKRLEINKIEKLINYISKKIKEHEKWVKRKK